MSAEAAAAQREAIGKYIAPAGGVLAYLKDIHQPTLIVQGSNDVIIPTVNSYILQQSLPNAELILYPDANHGSFYQYPELFVSQADRFLRRPCKTTIRICSPPNGCRSPHHLAEEFSSLSQGKTAAIQSRGARS